MDQNYPFACEYTPQVPEILEKLNISLALTSHQSGKVIFLCPNAQEEKLTQLLRTFESPKGLVIDENTGKMALAAKNEVLVFGSHRSVAPLYPKKPNVYDNFYIPHLTYKTGYLDLHDIRYSKLGLVGVSTSFSALVKFSDQFSCEPIWQPKFVSQFAGDDRCHLNGLALENGEPKYISMLGISDSHRGWKEKMMTSGALMDLDSEELINEKLAVPHSPILINDKLYILQSATGEICEVDRNNGKINIINKITGFVRGIAYYKDHLFVGVSKIRKKHLLSDIPLTKVKDQIFCGVTIIHLPTGAILGNVKYHNSCEEIYEVAVLKDQLRPNILSPANPEQPLLTPEHTFWLKREESSEEKGY